MYGDSLSERIAMINRRQRATKENDDHELVDTANKLPEDAIIISEEVQQEKAVRAVSKAAKADKAAEPVNVPPQYDKGLLEAITSLNELVSSLSVSISEIKEGLATLGVINVKKEVKKGAKKGKK